MATTETFAQKLSRYAVSPYVQSGVLLVFSLVLIFFQFPSIPQGLAFDEVENANLAVQLAEQGYIPYTEYATGHATFYYYIILGSLSLFGLDTFALRLPAAVFGSIAVVFFYLLMRQIFQKYEFLPFLVAVLFISTRWYYNFTRFSFQATFLILLELASLLALFVFTRQKNHLVLAVSGLFAGLAFNSYQPGRLFVFIPLFFFLFHVISEKGKAFLHDNQFYRQLATFIVPFVIVIFPLTSYLMVNPDIRVQQQLYFADEDLNYSQKASFLAENIAKTAGMFHVQGDLNGRHNYPGKPALNIIAGVLFLVGFIRAGIRFRDPTNATFLVFFFVSLVPTLLTYPSENPHMLRTIAAVPSVLYFCGLALMLGYDTIRPRTSLKPVYVYGILGLVVAMSALYDLRTYYVYQTQVFPAAFPIDMPLEEAVAQDTDALPQ